MRKLKDTFILAAKQVKHFIVPPTLKNQAKHANVPYFSQWESKELAADLIAGKVKATDDPKWRQSGATTKEEYDAWSWSGCGMACLKMILADLTGKTIPLVTLGKQCAVYGGYRLPLDQHPGLYYRPFVQFVRKEYGLSATAESALSLPEILSALSDNKYVIASVSPSIRYLNQPPPRKGGHLILLLGYDLGERLLWFHNPSGTKPETQEYAQVTFTQFNQFFDHKGILIVKN